MLGKDSFILKTFFKAKSGRINLSFGSPCSGYEYFMPYLNIVSEIIYSLHFMACLSNFYRCLLLYELTIANVPKMTILLLADC